MTKMDTEITRSALIEEPCAAVTAERAVRENKPLLWLKKLVLTAAMFCFVLIGVAAMSPGAEATFWLAAPNSVTPRYNGANINFFDYGYAYTHEVLISTGSPNEYVTFSPAVVTNLTRTSATITNLNPDQTYYVMMRVTDAAGGSPGAVSYREFTTLANPMGILISQIDNGTTRTNSISWGESGTVAIWRKDGVNGSWTTLTYSSSSPYTDNVVAGHSYYYCATKANIKGDYGTSTNYDGNPSLNTYGPSTFKPAAPTVFYANSADAYGITLGWTESYGATGYKIEWGTGGNYDNSFTGTGTSLYFNGFPLATTVNLRISAYNTAGNSFTYAYLNTITACATPNTPTATAGAGQNTVSWTAVTGASSYNVYRSTSSGGTYNYIGNSNGLSFNDTTAVSGTTYYYKVTAKNIWESQMSAASAGVSSTLGVPTGLTGTPSGTTGANLSWTAPLGAASYTVYRSTTSGGTFTQVGTSTTASFSDTGLSSGTKYYYKVTATNSLGTSANSAEASVAIPCAAPVLTATPAATQITLTWAAVTNAQSYTVKCSVADDGVYEETLATGLTATTYTDTDLFMDTTYYYAVYAVNSTPSVESTPGTVSGKTLSTVEVTFDPQSGTVTPTTQTKLNGSTYGKGADGAAAETLPTPTRTGYTFTGWYTAATGGTQVLDTTSVNSATAHTLYARWTADTVTITYDANGGSPTPATQTKLFDSTYGKGADGTTADLMPTTPTRMGYTFSGWYTAATGGTEVLDTTTVSTATPHTLYAHWGGVKMTVTYDPNGGTVSTATQTKLFNSAYGLGADGTTMEEMPTPTRAGYTFAGWYTASTSGTQVLDTTTVTNAVAHTLYAKWTANAITVTFDPQGGTVTPTTQTKLYDSTYGKGADGTTAEAMPTPTRTGYTFGGWYTAASGGTQVLDTSSVTNVAAHTLYAKWTAGTVTVTYDPNGGTVSTATQTKLFDSTYGVGSNGTTAELMPTSTRTGYTFAGWYTAATGGTQVLDTTAVSTSTAHTLYAHWTTNTYIITYDANGTGATVTPTSQTKLYDSTYGKGTDGTTAEAMPTPTRTGYTFNGWNTKADGTGTTITDATTVSITAAQTLYAKWTIITYNISYDGNSSTGGNAPATANFSYGASATVSGNTGGLVKTGYTFAGWNTEKDKSGLTYSAGTSFTINSDMTLYAMWTLDGYTLTYSGNGNTGGTIPASKTYYYGDSFAVDDNTGVLTRKGYTFNGWNTAANGSGTQYTSGGTFTAPAASLTLYAQWTVNNYTVTYNGNGYEGGTVPVSTTNSYDSTVIASLNTGSLIKTGYTFAGWNTKADGSGTSIAAGGTFTMGDANVTLYAVWTINSYKITYNGNGSDGGTAPATQEVKYGDSVTASSNTFTKTGATFYEWNTAADGSGTKYKVGDIFKMGPADVTLYAIWDNNTYTISYDKNGADNGELAESAEVKYGDPITIAGVGTLTKTGHSFSGWNTKADGTGTPYAENASVTMPSGDLTLYAQWTPNSYTITFEVNGGTAVTSITQNYGTTIASVTEPTKTGYVFYGWYLDAGFVSPVQFPYTVTDNATLYAKWIEKGDANTNGALSLSDARTIARISLGLETTTSTGVNPEVADINGDGKISLSDARQAARKALGLA